MVTIRGVRGGDFERLAELFVRAGLGGPTMAATLELVKARLGGAAFVAEAAGGCLVGAGAAVAFGPSGWVGGVAVLPERRGAGLGSALTATAIDWLREAGAATVSLHATELGRPVYERLGFAAEGRWLFLAAAPAAAPSRPPTGVRAARPGDLEAVLALDRGATGEDRSRLLRLLWDGGSPPAAGAGGAAPGGGAGGAAPGEGTGRVAPGGGTGRVAPGGGAGGAAPGGGAGFLVAEAGRPGRLAGFHAPRPGGAAGGATVATDADAGAALLAAWQPRGGEVTAVLPEANADGRLALEALGYRLLRTTALMRLGPGPACRPEQVFGGFNLFWG